MASAAVVSGKSPNASESTTEMKESEASCLSTAFISDALVPMTTISSIISSSSATATALMPKVIARAIM